MNNKLSSQIMLNAQTSDGFSKTLSGLGISKFLLVCGRSFDSLPIADAVKACGISFERFSAFSPNPDYEEVCAAARLFKAEGCDGIVAAGGGSAIDIAKCVKLFCRMDDRVDYLEQEYEENSVPLIAIPTTAGSGSESTHFAAVYVNGVKRSLANEALLPGHVILDPHSLDSLPVRIRKYTLLDALCQAVEAWWSVNSTPQSINYSRAALSLIMSSADEYISGGNARNKDVQTAANLAGRAINIAKTTAAHAMSYGLTVMYGLPHGHAAALCLPAVWQRMLGKTGACRDSRGEEYLKCVFLDISHALGCESPSQAVTFIDDWLGELEIYPPDGVSDDDVDILTNSVNCERLENNPIALDSGDIRDIYREILQPRKQRCP